MAIELGIELDQSGAQADPDRLTALAGRAEAGGLDLVVVPGECTGEVAPAVRELVKRERPVPGMPDPSTSLVEIDSGSSA